MRRVRGPAAPLIAGLVLLAIGGLALLGLWALQQSVTAQTQSFVPLRTRTVEAIARQTAQRLFPKDHLLGVYTAGTLMRSQNYQSKNGKTSVSTVTVPAASVVLLLGNAQGAQFAAVDKLFPAPNGQPPQSANWMIPLLPSPQGVRAVHMQDLSPALRVQVRRWVQSYVPSGRVADATLRAWAFPAGTLVIAPYRGQYAVALFAPPLWTPSTLQGVVAGN